MLPKNFVILNSIIKEFNTGKNVSLFGENKYLLLQGNQPKGYTIYLMEGNIGEGRVYQMLTCCATKKEIIAIMEVLDRLAIPPAARAEMAKYITMS